MIPFIRTVRGAGFLRPILAAGLLFCGVCSVFGQVSAGEPRTESLLRLSPDAAVEMAVKNNLDLESARIGLDIKKRKKDLIWNQFLPDLSANGTLARTNWELMPGAPRWSAQAGFSASLNFSFALVEGIRTSRLEYEAGLLSLDKAKLQMEQIVRKLYNQTLLMEATLALQNDSLKNNQRQMEIAEANYRAGLAPRLTWLQAQVAVENMKPQVNELDNALKTLKGNLAILLGLPFDAAFELDPIALGSSFIPLDLAELISKSAAKPDIMELQANIAALQSQRKALAVGQYTPFLRLGWNLSTMFNPMLDPFEGGLFNTDNWQKGDSGTGGVFSVTLGFSLNGFLPFTKEGQQRKDADAGIQIQNIQLAKMMRETEMEIFTKINSLEKTRTTAEAQQAAVDLAEQSYRLTEEAYRAGLQDLQAVQDSTLALEQAKLQLLTQQFNFLNDLIDLEYSIGVPFGTLKNKGSAE